MPADSSLELRPASEPGRPRVASSGLLCLIIAGLLWGTGGITGRELHTAAGVAPVAVAGYRLALGGAVVVLALLLTGRRPPVQRTAWRRIALVGALAAVFQATYFVAVAIGTVSLATLVAIGSSPVFVLVIESLRHRRWPNRRSGLVVSCALIGLVLLVGVPAGGTSMAKVLACAAVAALSGFSFALFTLLGRRPLIGLDEQGLVGYGFLSGGALLLLLAAFSTGIGLSVSPQSLGLLAYLAVAPTALAYAFFFRGLRDVPAATATVVALLEPLTGTVLSIIFFGDRLSLPAVVGALLLAAAIAASAGNQPAPTGGV